jgi:ATP-dependent DNA helicase PIF1
MINDSAGTPIKLGNGTDAHVIQKIIMLDVVFRQNEPELIDMLNDVRYNACKESTIKLLDFLERPLDITDGILPTRLYCRNADVDQNNITELHKLSGDSKIFKAEDFGDEKYRSKLDMLPLELELRVGAQVMLLVNHPDIKTLVNGSRGVVTKIDDDGPVVKFADTTIKVVPMVRSLESKKGEILASRCQVPLKLAWSLTIHKSQGMSIDRLEVKIDDAFEYGMAYVALSRARTLAGLRVVAYNKAKFRINPKVKKFYKAIYSH